jgi:Family of unknown function (DUF6481)
MPVAAMLRAPPDLGPRLTANSRPFDSAGPICSQHPFRGGFAGTLSDEENIRSMSRYDDSTFRDRLTRASEAKQATLAKFKQALDPGTPEAMERLRQRELIAAARAERNAKRETARQERERELATQAVLAAQAAAEAERAAMERAAREAAEKAELEAELKAEEAERQAALEAEQKAKRDARYAARKAAKKRRRRGL